MRNGFHKNNIVPCNKITVGTITFGIILIFNELCKHSSFIYETIYLKGIFQVIRIVHDFTLGLLPIPSIYIVLFCFLIYFFRSKLGSIKAFLAGLTGFLIWVLNCFYLLWGFNYTQPSIYESLAMDKVQLDSTYIRAEFTRQTKIVEELATKEIKQYSHSLLESEIRPVQERLLQRFGMPTIGRVRIRKVPKRLLLLIRTSGIYIPHAIEGHIDPGLYYKQHPFTIAHEMAHGYGYTDESVCNFIAYLTCLESDNLTIQYSAKLAYWRYLAIQFRDAFPEEYSEKYNSLDPSLLSDLKSIRKHIEQYKDLMPVMKDKIYDSYLKTHGVKAGIKSYDMMIELIAAYNARPD